jgi:exonuclease SbcD
MSQTSLRILHFADAHIDIANYGRHDPETALPVRVMDFLRSLDQIIDRAVGEPVDLVIFAGDAYKDRNPQPTFQREWGKRMMRLSEANISTILLVGNHDIAPSFGRANTLQEYKTLAVPHIHVADAIGLFTPDQLGIPVQVLTIPWISRSALLTREEVSGKSLEEVLRIIEERVSDTIHKLIDVAQPDLPLILTAHSNVQGARYGSERSVMLGQDLMLGGAVVNDKRIDYVALGHIHKHQSLNDERHPPIIYPGSIERIDFGEARETKGFVLADVSRGECNWQFVKLDTRPFLDFAIESDSAETFMQDILDSLPNPEKVAGAICRVQLRYPREWEPLVDEAAINERFRDAHSLQILKIRDTGDRSRLGDTLAVETLSPEELLTQYWLNIGLEDQEADVMQQLARDVLFGRSDD